LHELRDRRRVGEVFNKEDRRFGNEHARTRLVEQECTPYETRIRRRVRVGALTLLEVIDILDLRVRADPVVVAAEVLLPVCEEDRLVLRVTDRGDREVPPLGEEQRPDE